MGNRRWRCGTVGGIGHTARWVVDARGGALDSRWGGGATSAARDVPHGTDGHAKVRIIFRGGRFFCVDFGKNAEKIGVC